MILPVKLGKDSYDILMEPGCLRRAGEELDLDRRVLIVTDEGVPPRYGEALAAQCAAPRLVTVPQGEDSKSFSMLERLLTEMLRDGFTRGDCVAAVGGGVVGDLSGFAAACYMRGIGFYNLPTTLLSMVDSSVGGKTAVNLGGVKNVAGAFYQPKKVLIDPDTLKTLDPRQMACGMAEAVKMALTFDAAGFETFERLGASPDYPALIAAALRIKAQVVERDERESGLRKVLNFGHTIGHGIEAVTGLPHGECVALGMLPMCAPAVRARLLPVLEKLGLPTAVKADPEAVYAALLHDKKAGAGGLTLVRVEEPGRYVLETAAPETLREKIRMVVRP